MANMTNPLTAESALALAKELIEKSYSYTDEISLANALLRAQKEGQIAAMEEALIYARRDYLQSRLRELRAELEKL